MNLAMKKIKYLTLLCVLFFSLSAFSQDKFASYESSFYNKRLDIFISLKGSQYSLWVNALSLSDSTQIGGIVIREKNLFKFLESMKYAKLKYEEYEKVAKRDSVKREDKTMRIFNTVDVFSIQGEKYVYADIPLNFDFKVRMRNGIKYYLLFVNTSGYNIVLSSSEEIQEFIDRFSSTKINEYVTKNQDMGFLSPLTVSEPKPAQLSKKGFLSRTTLGIKASSYINFGMNNVNFENFNDYEVVSASFNNTKSFSLGLFVRIPFNNFLFQPEVSYQMGEMSNFVGFYDKHIQKVNTKNAVKLGKLDVPLLIGYNIYNAPASSLKILVGTNLLFNVNSKMDNTYFHTEGTTLSRDITYTIDPFKLGYIGGLEFDFYPVTIGVRYNFIKNSNTTNCIIRDINGNALDSRKIGSFSANTFEFSFGWKIFQPKYSHRN